MIIIELEHEDGHVLLRIRERAWHADTMQHVDLEPFVDQRCFDVCDAAVVIGQTLDMPSYNALLNVHRTVDDQLQPYPTLSEA